MKEYDIVIDDTMGFIEKTHYILDTFNVAWDNQSNKSISFTNYGITINATVTDKDNNELPIHTEGV